MAERNPKQYNQTESSPKENQYGKIKPLRKWNLNELINVSFELGYSKQDIKKFSHVLRDFRNYIHPTQQMFENFNPDIKTAEICVKVLEAAIYQLSRSDIK